MVDPRVLVVGAGPTGLTLACELRRHGVACRIIDREPTRHAESRATDLHPRTLELFHDLGVLDAVQARATTRTAVNMFWNGERFLHVTFEDAATSYGYMLGMSQSEIEQILEARLVELGGHVERGVRFAGFEQHADGVEAILLHGDRTWDAPRFSWLVGCDGAHSTVRAGLEMALEGTTFDEHFLLGDVRVSWDLPRDQVQLFTSDDGVMIVLSLPDGWTRIFGDIADDDAPALDLATCERMIRTRARIPATVHDHGWITTFRAHTRMVRAYRRDRVFLAGDAAHIHSPVGGHGMNTGIQDAYNLAWKLALACRGEAHPDLLDSYQAERQPIARDVLAQTDFETRISLWKSRLAKGAVNALFSIVGKLGPIRRRMIASALETTVGYHDSPIVGEHRSSVLHAPIVHDDHDEAASLGDRARFSDGPRAGEHLRDVALDGPGPARLFDLVRGGVHTVLLFDGAASTDDGYRRLSAIATELEACHGERLRVHVVIPRDARPAALTWSGSVVLGANAALHARYGAAAECAYVIRPDRYVGFRSQPADRDALRGYFTRVFAP